jgi:hypothetical protein
MSLPFGGLVSEDPKMRRQNSKQKQQPGKASASQKRKPRTLGATLGWEGYSYRSRARQLFKGAESSGATQAEWALFAIENLATEFIQRKDARSLHGLQIVCDFALSSLLEMTDAGQRKAAELVTESLTNAIWKFLRICAVRPELFAEMARRTTDWPGLFSCDRQTQKYLDGIRNRLPLGEGIGLNYCGKLAREFGSQIALGLFGEIDNARGQKGYLPNPDFTGGLSQERLFSLTKNLPALSRDPDVQKKWWRVMEQLFVGVYGTDFENGIRKGK